MQAETRTPGRRRGRPRSAATAGVRVFADLMFMLSEVIRHERVVCADFLDPLIRPEIEAKFAKLPKVLRDRAKARLAELTD